VFDGKSCFKSNEDLDGPTHNWQDQDALMTALAELERSLSAAIEILHPDTLNSEFPSM
jgi:hypothetical protein